MKLIWCDGFPEIYAWLEEEVGESIYHGYMCIVLYMKHIWCDGFPEIYARLEEVVLVNLPWVYVHCAIYETYLVWWFSRDLCSIGGGGGGQSAMGICALRYIWNLFGVMVFQRSMLDWRRGRGFNLPWVYVHCAIYETYLVWWFSRDLCLIGGGGRGVNLSWVYVHCAIYETYLVWWFSRDLCSIGGGVGGSICHGYMCIVIYMKLIWCDGFPEIYAWLEEG